MKHLRKLSRLFALFLLFPLVLSCNQKPALPDYSGMEEFIEHTTNTFLTEHNIKGLAVGFIDADGYQTAHGFGKVEASSVFPLASVTKVFTALAVMQLAEEGILDLDGHVETLLPDLELKKPHPGSPPITVRHLLTHTSGLTRDILSRAQGNRALDQSTLLDYLNNHPQVNPAGYRHGYSNPGFELLGLIIENLTGQSYTSYIREHLLIPLEMHASSFSGEPSGDQPAFVHKTGDQQAGDRMVGVHQAGAYTPWSDSLYRELPIQYTAAGGLKSNVPDLLNLLGMLLRPEQSEGIALPGPSYIREMFHRQNTDVLLDRDIQMGAGLFLEDLPDPFSDQLVFHGGGAIFTNTMLMFAPNHGIGVVVLSNTAGSYPLVDQLARLIIHEALEIKTGEKAQSPEPFTPPMKGQWAWEEKQSLTGDYFTHSGIVRIRMEEDSIFALSAGQKLPLRFYENGIFSYHEGFYCRIEDAGNKRILFYLNQGLLTPFGKRQEDPAPRIPESWRNAAGLYQLVKPYPEESVAFYESLRVSILDDMLYLGMLPGEIIRNTYGINSEINVFMVAADAQTAIMQGFGRYLSEPVFLDEGGGTLTFAGLKFHKTKP